MEEQNLNQYQGQNQNRIEPKIRVSRDGKWIIISREDIEQPIIKAVAYFEKIIENAKSRSFNAPVNVEKIKG